MQSWKTPTEQQIDAALRRIRSPEFEAYFFARLENPHWIAPLRNRGVFASPPPPAIGKGGRASFPVWPASKYLVRMVKHAPDDVALILAELETNNPIVVGDIVEAALAMPVGVAALLVPSIARAAPTGALAFQAMQAAALCSRLAADGEADPAMALAESLFKQAFDQGEKGPRQWRTDSYMDALSKPLPTLTRARTSPFLVRLCKWLSTAIEAEHNVDSTGDEDYSFLWRQAIEDHAQNDEFDFAGNLVGLVREAFDIAIREQLLSLNGAIGILDRFHYLIFKRLRMHLINEFADSNPELARQVIMDHDLFADDRYRHEYALLVGQRLDVLSSDERKAWFEWVDEGPEARELEGLVDEDRQRRIDHWRFNKLHWVRSHLDIGRRDFYDTMLATHGEPKLAKLHMYTSGAAWGRSISPLSVADLSGGSFADAVELVALWRPQETLPIGPGLEGLASTFEEYVMSAPEAFSAQATALIGRPAIYVRGFLNQMTETIKTGNRIYLRPILELCEWVLSRPPEERSTPRQDEDSLVDRNWQWTRDQVSRLIEAMCQAREDGAPTYPLEGLRERSWSLLSILYSDPSQSYIVERESDPRAEDYLTAGINSSRGKAVEACLEYARWVADHIKIEGDGHDVVPDGFRSMPEVRDMLEWQIETGNRSFEALAIIGLHLGLIYWIDREWLAWNADRLFDLEGVAASPRRVYGWAAWNSFLVWVRPHIEFYKLFKEQFAYAAEQSGRVDIEEAPREDPMSHLGEHLMVLYGRGQLTLGEDGSIVQRFIRETSPRVRRHAIGFVGRILWQEKTLPADVVARFMSLWEAYWGGPGPQDARAEPAAWLFGVWFASEQVPEEWAIRHLSAFVDVVPIPGPDHAVAERLAQIAPADITAATEILDKMIRGDREGWHVHIWRESVRKILALAIEAGGPARSQAERTIDCLGRRGYLEFGTLL